MQEAAVVIDSTFKVDEASIEIAVIDDKMNAANCEGESILNQAKLAAEHCLSEAKEQAALIKKQAYDEGYQQGNQEGYQEGVTQGQQAGRSEMEELINQTIATNQNILLATEQETKAMMLAAEKQIVDIALAVARKILAHEITENPAVVLPLVKAALQKVSDQEEIVIRVSHEDFEALLLAKQELQTMVGGENSLAITVDRTIERGNCIIDTSYGTVDARVDTQLETIRKALQGVA